MDLGVEVIDFHVHFPTNRPWFADMGPDIRQQYIERRGAGDGLQPGVANDMGIRATGK